MSGFKAAAVDEIFFAGTALETNFILNIGYGDPSLLRSRLPRLEFHEVELSAGLAERTL
jgi:3-hydroxypropanoate dehydrogenase